MTSEQRVALWDAINRYVKTCGGDPGTRTVSTPRMEAVVEVERVAREVDASAREEARADLAAARAENERLKAEVERWTGRRFPVLQGAIRSVPWAFMEQYAGTAERNHDQSLETLASRGGLSVSEIVWAMEGGRFHGRKRDEAADLVTLNAAVSAFLASTPTTGGSAVKPMPTHFGPPWDTTRDASEFEPLCYDHGGGNLTPNAVARTCSHEGCDAVTFGVAMKLATPPSGPTTGEEGR